MVCNINRSITVGILTTLVMTLIIFIWLGPTKMREMNMTLGNLLLLMAVLLVISVSMDVFDQCYTVCESWSSSLKYGAFTVGLIYLFFNLFINRIPITQNTVLIFIINVILLALLHNVGCKYVHPQIEKTISILFIV